MIGGDDVEMIDWLHRPVKCWVNHADGREDTIKYFERENEQDDEKEAPHLQLDHGDDLNTERREAFYVLMHMKRMKFVEEKKSLVGKIRAFHLREIVYLYMIIEKINTGFPFPSLF